MVQLAYGVLLLVHKKLNGDKTMFILLISEDGKSNRKQKRFQNHSEAFANYQRLVGMGLTVEICVNIEKGDK